jgi:1-deoxy-D-xylulose-5-phosphate reductoisomerase
MTPVNRVVVIGATGSIGRQALDVIQRFPAELELVGAVAGRRAAALAEALRPFPGARAVIVDPDDPVPEGMGVGPDAACALAASPDADVILVGGGGAGALLPTLAACETGACLAVATKEVLVMAGELVTETAAAHHTTIMPVDSEHSAIWQCLRGERPEAVARLVLTASGGPFRLTPLEEIPGASREQALAHPNWRMGPKVTIDSATMMNKGLEVIEAHFLFGLPYQVIDVVVHPQSAVHSAVEFCDGTLIAQLGIPDMRAPIALALSGGRRLPGVVAPLQLTEGAHFDFEPLDPRRYPALDVARRAAERGGGVPAAMNAANEVAVAAFLEGRISFGGIAEVVAEVSDSFPAQPVRSLAEVLAADAAGRRQAQELVLEVATFPARVGP